MADLKFRPEIEILSACDVGRRRQWSEDEKLRIVEECTAPGSLDNRLHYAAHGRFWSSHLCRAAAGLRWPLFSISHWVL